ncbi:MAG: tape measure protein [Lysinibacillus sp.]
MATIRTSIQIQDRLSQPMRAMHNAVSMMVNQMEAMHSASGNMMNTSSIELARRELSRAAESMNRIEQEVQGAATAQQRFTNNIRDGTSALGELLGKILAVVGAYLSLRSIQDVVRLSDEMSNIDARLNLVIESMPKIDDVSANLNINTSGLTEVEQLQKQIFDAAQRSFAPYAQTANLVGKIGMNAKDAFNNTSEVVVFAELLNKQFGIAGTNAEGVSSATLQLTQALGSGVLRGEELNSVFEAAPNIIHTIAEYLDEPIGRIREMAADGKLTADVVKNAMFSAADGINEKFNSMPLTFQQIWTEFKNNALWAFKGVLQQINNTFNSDRFAAFRESAGQSLNTVATLASHALNMIASVGAFVYDNWSFIAPVVGGATGALVAYGAALVIAKAATMLAVFWTGLQTLALGLYTATSWASVTATLAATGAVWGLNAALYANPIFWIVIAIILLIGVLYLAVAAVNYFAGTSISATGIIAGAFATAGAFIANVLMGILEIAFGVIEALWNKWIAFANFFGNVLNDPVASIIHLFGDLGDNVLGVIEKIASAIDFVFGSNLANAVAGWRSELAGLVNWAADEYGNGQYEVLYEKLDMDSVMSDLGLNLNRFEYSSAWDTGYNWGADLFNGSKDNSNQGQDMQKLMDEAMKGAMGGGGLGDKLDKANRNGGSTAGNTAKMAKTMEGAGEDLKYMRDLAEREFINRFTTAKITVDMTNHNTIDSELDLDGIVNHLGEKLEETLDSVAAGV